MSATTQLNVPAGNGQAISPASASSLRVLKGMRVRTSRAINQKQLASRVGITPSALSRIVSGDRNPKLETLEKIAKAIGVSVGECLRMLRDGTMVKAA